MKNENIIMVVALVIFCAASSVVAHFLPFALSTLYIHGNYTFDLTLVKTLTDVYVALVFVATPILIMWITIESLIDDAFKPLWRRWNERRQNTPEQTKEV